MKSSLAFSAEPFLAAARRLFWLSLWLLWIPLGVYITLLNRGYDLGLLQMALLVISILGLGVINSETASVIYSCLGPTPWLGRGFLQRLGLGSWPGRPRPARPSPRLPLAMVTASPVAVPFVSVIVVAYLPNEQDIIEDTLLYWLTQVTPPAQGWEIILAYNTSTRLPVEARLRRLAQRYPALVADQARLIRGWHAARY